MTRSWSSGSKSIFGSSAMLICWMGEEGRRLSLLGLGMGAWMEEERPKEPEYSGSSPSDLRRFLLSTVFQPLSSTLAAVFLVGRGFGLGSFFASCFGCLFSRALPLLSDLVDCGGGGVE